MARVRPALHQAGGSGPHPRVDGFEALSHRQLADGGDEVVGIARFEHVAGRARFPRLAHHLGLEWPLWIRKWVAGSAHNSAGNAFSAEPPRSSMSSTATSTA